MARALSAPAHSSGIVSVPLALTADSWHTWIKRMDKLRYTNMSNQQQFLEYCFSWLPEARLRQSDESDSSGSSPPSPPHSQSATPAIVVGGIREVDVAVPPGSLGILLCCEDCRRSDATALQWGYVHYHKHGDTGDPNVRVYFYNHYSRLVRTQKHMIVPFAYLYMSYCKRKHKSLFPRSVRPPQYRKFCIITTARHKPLQEWIKRLGPTDHISQFTARVGSESCYHGQKLIDLLSEYKFVLCGENAFHAGYITEKVFNAFFARTIPIYSGPPDTLRYLNPSAAVLIPSRPTKRVQLQLARRILTLARSPAEYARAISQYPLNPSFDDENYESALRQFIQPWLNVTRETRSQAVFAHPPASGGSENEVSISTDTGLGTGHPRTLPPSPERPPSTQEGYSESPPGTPPPSTPDSIGPRSLSMSPPCTPGASYDLTESPPAPGLTLEAPVGC